MYIIPVLPQNWFLKVEFKQHLMKQNKNTRHFFADASIPCPAIINVIVHKYLSHESCGSGDKHRSIFIELCYRRAGSQLVKVMRHPDWWFVWTAQFWLVVCLNCSILIGGLFKLLNCAGGLFKLLDSDWWLGVQLSCERWLGYSA